MDDLRPSAADRVPDRDHWERQPGETSRQFACFCAYRDMHPLERSLAKVGRQLGFSTSYLERLSSKGGWKQRIAEWDREHDRKNRVRHAKATAQMNEQLVSISTVAFKKIAESVELIDPRKLKPTDIARLLDSLCRAERFALDATAASEPDGKVSLPRAADIRKLLIAEKNFTFEQWRKDQGD